MTAPGGSSEQSIVVEILANIQGLLSGMKSAAAAVQGASESIVTSLDEVKGAAESMLAPLIAFTAIFAAFREVKEGINKLQEMALSIQLLHEKTGIAVETLSELKYIVELNHASFDQFGLALGRLARKMEEAVKVPTGPAAEAFKALGVSIADAAGNLRPLDQVFFDIADKFHAMEDGAKKTALAIDIFGRSGALLIPTLNLGREGIRVLADEAHRLGIVITKENIESIDEFHHAVQALKGGIGGLVLSLSTFLVPVLEATARFFTAVTQVLRAFGNGLKAVWDGVHGRWADAKRDALDARDRLLDAWKSMSQVSSAAPDDLTKGAPPKTALRETITAMERFGLELAQLREQHKDDFGQMKQLEVDFWQSKLQEVKKGSKDYIAVYQHYVEALQSVERAKYEGQLESVRADEALHKDDLQYELAARIAELAIIRQHYGAMSKEVQEGIRRVNEATAKLWTHEAQTWEHVFDGIGQSFAGVLNQMKQSGGTFRDYMRAVLKDLVTDFALAELSILKAHIARWLAQKGITAQGVAVTVAMEAWGALKVIAMKAAEAAASAWAAIAGIPYIGPFLAPAAAAAAFAGVLALAGGIKSAAGGYDIPAGLNPIVQTHAREMILPQKYADVIRGLEGGGGGGGGEIHLHVHAMDSADVGRFIMKHKGAVAAAVHAAAQGGQGFRSQPGRRA